MPDFFVLWLIQALKYLEPLSWGHSVEYSFFFEHASQISVVDQCQLTKKGELPFDMVLGACAQRDNREVFICFANYGDSSTSKNCHRSNAPLENFWKMPSSTYDHRWTSIAVTSGKPGLQFN